MAARCALPGVQAATDPAAHSVSASVLGVVPTWGSRLADPGRHGDAVMAPAGVRLSFFPAGPAHGGKTPIPAVPYRMPRAGSQHSA